MRKYMPFLNIHSRLAFEPGGAAEAQLAAAAAANQLWQLQAGKRSTWTLGCAHGDTRVASMVEVVFMEGCCNSDFSNTHLITSLWVVYSWGWPMLCRVCAAVFKLAALMHCCRVRRCKH
jgi:hypothetical protein